MRLGSRARAVPWQLADTPLADRLDLAAWLPHSTALVPFTPRRYHPTPPLASGVWPSSRQCPLRSFFGTTQCRPSDSGS